VWGDRYIPSKYYRFLFERAPQDKALIAIWDSKALPKLKAFLWLLMIGRLNTRDIMLRKHWHIESGPDCILRSANILETRQHLFFECVFARECWQSIGIHWSITQNFSHEVCNTKASFIGPCFMEIFASVAWNIWKAQNEYIFQNITPSVNRWRVGFQHDLLLHRFKVKSSLVQPLIDWPVSIFV
jgi:hypothetical protein